MTVSCLLQEYQGRRLLMCEAVPHSLTNRLGRLMKFGPHLLARGLKPNGSSALTDCAWKVMRLHPSPRLEKRQAGLNPAVSTWNHDSLEDQQWQQP